MNGLDRLVNFDNTDGAGSPPPEGEQTPPESGSKWTSEQQAEFDKRAASLRKSALEEGRKKAQAEFEAKQKEAQEAIERKRLEEEGQFKDLAAKNESAKSAAEKRAEEAEQKANALALQMSFSRTARILKIEFANEQAEIDAFSHLDRSLIGDDGSGMPKAFEKLQKEHPHYFGEPQQSTNTDAALKGRKQTNQKSDDERKAEIVQRFNIRRPR